MRRLHGSLVLATHNQGKLEEMQAFFAPFPVSVVSLGDFGLAEPEETGTTFLENARIKAKAALQMCQMPVLADDSGLCVDDLDGAPGVYSADWAGSPRDFYRAMALVERKLRESGRLSLPAPRAHFHATLVLAWPDGEEAVFTGDVHGHLVFPPRGTQGFGYDPIFIPDGQSQTFAQLGATAKNSPETGGLGLSHRARALAKLQANCL